MRPLEIAALALLVAVSGPAQNQGGGAAPTPSTPAPPAGNTSGRVPNTPNTRSPFPDSDTFGQRPIFLSGKVVLADGLPLPDRVKIERVCNGTPRTEAYTDRRGRFSFEVGRNLEMQDASSSTAFGDGFPGSRTSNTMSQLGGGAGERSLWGCELRAVLAGYRSDMLNLANIHYMDNPDLGTIVLHPLGKVDGLTISVTSALAPKDARRAFEKGMEAIGKKNPDEAQKNFEKAVALYPKYSTAWFELGRVHEQRDHFDEAKKAYQQAIDAEPKFLQPYERLSWLALKDSQWQELGRWTDQLVRLDPLNNPDSYYLSSIANLQLHHYDVAEKNAREAIKLDPARKNMRTHYVLGLVLAEQQQFAASADSLREFLNASPGAKDADFVRKQLSEIEQAAREKAAQQQ